MARFFSALGILALLAALPGCDGARDDGIVDAVIIGDPESMFDPGLRLSAPAQLLRGATTEGLVAFDASGEVVPALADRWIVTDDGQSYIFRLRDGEWAGGTALTSETVKTALTRAIAGLRGTSLGLDLAPVTEVRAMTGRVVEIRLEGPVPGLLQLLAQPELGLRRNASGVGPMALERKGDAAELTMLPPDMRGLPMRDDWEEYFEPIRVTAASADKAIAQFDSGAADIVLNGRISSLSLADTGALSRGTVRLDAAVGLFGLRIKSSKGFLSEAIQREAITLAIDRTALLEPFNIGGWVATTRAVAPDLDGEVDTGAERWPDLSIEQRQAIALQRVERWRAANGGNSPRLKIAFPAGPGSELLFSQIRKDLAAAGITSELVTQEDQADLVLVDRLARFASPRWFLNQFNCSLNLGLCSPEVDALVLDTIREADPGRRDAILREAEAVLNASNIYIPFGAPIRWSLVRGNITGFINNRWGLHPLPPLANRPI
ncbi:ABC transporter substrate-binding protein [Altererythrobacter aquiaggeris]|uniref:ABC transporter substrate-binding protein n=1 Tax=Aestuarierythrobacter aquiaggeris TaxID=1898396 RepID=UPI00301633FB